MIDLDDLLDQRGRRIEARIGGEQARRVGEQHEQVGVDEMGDERGEPVVVTEANLVVGDGVVLVHHRQHAELQQPPNGPARVQVLLAHTEVERREQHLPRHDAELRERPVVDTHEAALPDR